MQGYKEGYAYHIKDSYFEIANDSNLMMNKENGNYRPTFYCMKDEKTSILWLVPISSQAEKYRKLEKRKIEKYGEALGIYIAMFDSKPAAFLVQNMFPITEKYIDHVHTRNGVPVQIMDTIQKEVTARVTKVLRLTERGKRIAFPDIKRLEKLMLDELAAEAELSDGKDVTDKEAPENDKPMFSTAAVSSDEFKPTSDKATDVNDVSKKNNTEL